MNSSMKKESVPMTIFPEKIQDFIYVIRDQRVILDKDLAKLYGVETRRLNEQVKRNIDRFPEDFMFQLTEKEVALRSQIATLKKRRGEHRKYLPFAFTEHGAIMAANLLRSPQAISVSIQVVRTFIELRKWTQSHQALIEEVDSLKNFVLKNSQTSSQEFRKVWRAIEKLMVPEPKPEERRIGFRLEGD